MTLKIGSNAGWPWILAGMVSGMAILTRATAIVLVGVVGLALMIQVSSRIRSGAGPGPAFIRAALAGAVWLITTAITIMALLPALWVKPTATVSRLWSWSSNAATEGHENPTFFRGVHSDDPGFWVYPVVLAWRTSVIEWIGVGLFLILVFWSWKRRTQPASPNFSLLLVCAVFTVVYIAAMSAGAKKFDRYILPVFPMIAIFAAHGLVLTRQWILANIRPGWSKVGSLLIIAAIIGQFVAWNGTRPYRLDYYNPILGGSIQAQYELQIGWGQGGDQVVEYLNDQANGEPITVQTSAVPSAFTYFLKDNSPIHFERFSMRTPAGWYETEYYVAGIQQTQRGLASEFELLDGSEPVHSVLINGVSYFDTYDVRNLPLPSDLATPTACNLTFGESITLMQIIGRDDRIDFYFLTTDEITFESMLFEVRLDWPDGITKIETAELNAAPGGRMSRMSIPYQPRETPLSEATITLMATVDSQLLAVSASWSPDRAERGQTHSECYYTATTD